MRRQFGLRSILAATTLVAIWCANYRAQADRAAVEQRSLTALSNGGCRVRATRDSRPAWVKYVIGPIFHKAEYIVELPPGRVTGDNIKLLEKIPNLREVVLASTADETEVSALKIHFPACSIVAGRSLVGRTARAAGGVVSKPRR